MNSAELEAQVIGAISERSEMAIDYKGDGERTVQPHALFRRDAGKVFVDALQTGGYSSSRDPNGWRQFELSEIVAARTLETSFEPSGEYDPASERYKAGLIKGVA